MDGAFVLWLFAVSVAASAFGGGQCGRLFHARLHHHRDRRTGGIWLSRWGDRGRAHAFDRLERQASAAVCNDPGGAWYPDAPHGFRRPRGHGTSMNSNGRLEESLAALLRYGSWLASAGIGVGFALALVDSRVGTRNLAILPNMRIAAIGIVLFILLPTLRVLLMLLVFIREGDFRLAATAGLVLAIILLGIVLGL